MKRLILILALTFPLSGQAETPLGTASNPPVVKSGVTLTIKPGATIDATGATVTGFGSGGTVPTGKTLWVDGTNGNNATAISGRLDKPYLTLASAKAAAVSGDTVAVLSGTYNENNLAKNGVNYRGIGNPNIVYTGSDGRAIFDDNNTAMTFSVTGFGTLEYNGAGTDVKGGVINEENASSHITVSAIAYRNRETSHAAIWQKDGILNLTAAETIEDLIGGAAAVYWENGDMHITSPIIRSTGYSTVYAQCPTTPTGKMWINADTIIMDSGGLGYAPVYFLDNNTTATVWIFAKEIINNVTGSSNNRGVIVQGIGRYYVTAQKISVASTTANVVQVTSDATGLWITTQKLTSGGSRWLSNTGNANIWLSVQNWQNTAGVTSGIVSSSGDVTVQGNGGLLTATTGATCSGGTLTINDVRFASTTDLSQSSTGTLNVTGGAGSATGGAYKSSGTITRLTQPYDSGLGLVKPAVAVASASNLTLSGEQTIDGVLTSGSLVLATGQSTGSENGPWVTAAGAWARPTWYTNASTTQAPQFLTTFVRLGTTYQGSTWRMTTASVTIGTTATTWVQTPIALGNLGGLGTGVSTALGTSVGSAGSFLVNGGALGTPSSGTLTSATGLPISTGVSGLGTGVATALAVANNAAGGYSPINGTATLTNKTIDKASNTLTGVAGSGANTDITSVSTLTSFGTGSANTLFNSTGLLQFGGTSSSFPALLRNGNYIEVKAGDNSGFKFFKALAINTASIGIGDVDGSTIQGSSGVIVSGLRPVAGIQALSGAGAVNLTNMTTAFTSSGAAQALTLADGTNGAIKTIAHVVDGGSGVLTPSTKSGYSTITFTNVGDAVTLQFFTTGGWIIIGQNGVIVTP